MILKGLKNVIELKNFQLGVKGLISLKEMNL